LTRPSFKLQTAVAPLPPTIPKTNTMPIAPIDGCDLYYDDSDPEGKMGGPAVIFVHGGAVSAMIWWQQVPTFRKKFRTIVYDARGFQRSVDKTGAGMSTLIEDLEALVDYLKLEKVALIGQSMGGRAVLPFAVRHPEKTVALVMCGTWGHFDWPEHWALAKDLEALPKTFETGKIWGMSKQYQAREENADAVYLFDQIKWASLAHKPKLHGTQPGAPNLEQVSSMKVPTLCITSDQDAVMPTPLVEGLAKIIPGAEMVNFPGVGHSAYYEIPGKFNETIISFIEKQQQQQQQQQQLA